MDVSMNGMRLNLLRAYHGKNRNKLREAMSKWTKYLGRDER